jgi:predicted phage baseplate assembly protein
MSGSVDQSIRNLNDCGCCSGSEAETPAAITNRPGLSAIAYRTGVYARFLASMLARLSTAGATSNLKTRDRSDYSIALLDAWASALDVLAFYQERIANESYLRTATERFSVLQLARLIGYEPRPGVSASVDLAFTLDDTASGPKSIAIQPGLKVQSVPGPNELPQTFESTETVEARPAWNNLQPRLTARHVITGKEDPVLFAGIVTGLKPGDPLLISPDDGSAAVFRQVARVTPKPAVNVTQADLAPLPPVFLIFVGPVVRFESPAFSAGSLASGFLGKTFETGDLTAMSLIQGFSISDLFSNLNATQPPPPSVLTFRVRAGVFGHNAPLYATLTADVTKAFPLTAWVDALDAKGSVSGPVTLDKYPGEEAGIIPLDNVYPGIARGSFVMLKDGGTTRTYQVKDVEDVTKANFTISLKITRLTLDSTDGLNEFTIRGTTIYAQSEELAVARDPLTAPVSGATIDLNGYVDGLTAGKRIIISGESADNRGIQVSETAVIASVNQVIATDGFTSLTLANQLSNNYVRSSAVIHGNVVAANHGERTSEVVGSGDSSKRYQAFTLRQPPLTYVSSSSSPSGAASTLKLFVEGVQWIEVPTLFDFGPRDRVFVARNGDDGNTTIEFGDGATGARLQTGQQNITAAYRKGIGLAGMVKAGQLTLLMTRPLGIRSVTNPQDASGGADPEALDNARQNASLTVLTLDRIVSLEDYENFARAFAGVGKALATWTWSGQSRGVFVTVAGPGGAAIDPSAVTFVNLLGAMQRFGDPFVPLRLAPYRNALFQLSARLTLASDRVAAPQPVLDAAASALRSAFSFHARSFGQPVHLSEVMAVIQGVAGIVAVDIDLLFRSDAAPALDAFLPSAAPQPGTGNGTAAAELLTLDPRPIALGLV